jgi:NAD(P)-dependent dehydrogenase (short-subunit alcohol dehydrogenase family)
MTGELSGEVALVTGAAGGIGGAVGTALHRAGAVVVGVDRNPGGVPEGIEPLAADLTDPAAADEAVRRAAGEGEGLSIVVNTVGTPRPRERSSR